MKDNFLARVAGFVGSRLVIFAAKEFPPKHPSFFLRIAFFAQIQCAAVVTSYPVTPAN